MKDLAITIREKSLEILHFDDQLAGIQLQLGWIETEAVRAAAADPMLKNETVRKAVSEGFLADHEKYQNLVALRSNLKVQRDEAIVWRQYYRDLFEARRVEGVTA